MTFDYELTLISKQSVVNQIGDPVTTETRTDILCDVRSITRSEHYAAAAHDLRPEIAFIVNVYDYSGQQEVEFEGVRYSVDRTYRAKESDHHYEIDDLELVCSRMVNPHANA